jgi:hypothetical protein
MLFGLGMAGTASATCADIKGKIFNNTVGPGSTLGTVHAVYGGAKFKCGLRGDGKAPDTEGDEVLNFTHTMVCDDDVSTNEDGGPVHSQLVWDTTGYFLDQWGDPWPLPYPPCALPDGPDSSDFVEFSYPVQGSGRFAAVQSGSIEVNGTIYCGDPQLPWAIDMKFSGELCP